jgi:enoyl-CoA hydratase/carnithine racemase
VSDSVLVERVDRVLVMTINRPKARNAIDRAVTLGLAAAVDELDERDDLSIGVLTGAGGTFCAGMDLKAFLAGEDVTLPGRGLGGICERPPRKPMIAAVDGWALAGGCPAAAYRADLVIRRRAGGIARLRREAAARVDGALTQRLAWTRPTQRPERTRR